jgi:hypothetical protein
LKQVQQLKQQFQVIHTVLEQQKGLAAGGGGIATASDAPPAVAGVGAGVARDQQQQEFAGCNGVAHAGSGACSSPIKGQSGGPCTSAYLAATPGGEAAAGACAGCGRDWLDDEQAGGVYGGHGWLPWEDPQLVLEAPLGGAAMEAELLLGALPMQQLRDAMTGTGGEGQVRDRDFGGLGFSGTIDQRASTAAGTGAARETSYGVGEAQLMRGGWDGLVSGGRCGWLGREGGVRSLQRGRGVEGLLEARLRRAYQHMLQQLHTRWQQEKHQLQLSSRQVMHFGRGVSVVGSCQG